MKLFQFWNDQQAPHEVEVLMKTWSDASEFEYSRYSTETAAAYIQERFDNRIFNAFSACGVPAMQADFFRYCALYKEGGVYIDADTSRRGDLMAFISAGKNGMFMMRQGRIANDFLFVRKPHNELYSAIIKLAVKNIEDRISNDVWQVTGPSITTGLYRSETKRRLFDGFQVRPIKQVKSVVQFNQEMEYKSGENDWRFGLESDEPRSIFNDCDPPE